MHAYIYMPFWREAHFLQVKMHKTHQVRSTFWSWDVEKVHVVVARSTFRSQNAKNTTCSGPFYVQMWFRVAGASTLDRWNRKIASALRSTFHFWRRSRTIAIASFLCQLRKLRKSRRIASFLTLSSSKIQEVSENCCVFDVAKVKNSGSLAD